MKNSFKAVFWPFLIGMVFGLGLGSVGTLWAQGKRMEASGLTFDQMLRLSRELPKMNEVQQDSWDDIIFFKASAYAKLSQGQVEEERQILRKQIVKYVTAEPPNARKSKAKFDSRASALSAIQRAMDADPSLQTELAQVWGAGVNPPAVTTGEPQTGN